MQKILLVYVQLGDPFAYLLRNSNLKSELLCCHADSFVESQLEKRKFKLSC
jgi:hypothetical protein